MRKLFTLRRPGWQASVAIAAVFCLPPQASGAADFSKYHNYDELTATLQGLVGEHPDIAKLVEVGKSRQGRTIWAVEIANPAGAPVETRPALLIAANFEGDHLIGSELALYAVDYLLGAYASNPEVKLRVDSQAFYIIPRVNPDGAEQMFAPVRSGRKTNATPFDGDNDGRVDEDGPEDLNRDGLITLMRVKDPDGEYMIHPDDSRLMKKADPKRGETGAYRIYLEGIDNDGDGFYNEDAPGGVDINRNFQHAYPYYTPDAGPHMVSELESRALMDYVIRRRNIAAVLTFGESDNLITAPNRRGEPGTPATVDLMAFAGRSIEDARRTGMFELETSRRLRFRFSDDEDQGGTDSGSARRQRPARRPAERINAADIDYFRTVSDKYRSLTGIQSEPPTRSPGGAFFEYCYYQYGVPSFSTPGWGLPAPARASGAGSGGPGARGAQRPAEDRGAPGAAGAQPDGDAGYDLRLLKWMDGEKIDGFVDWVPFEHPTLGKVEIGGFRPYATSNPPASRIADLGKTHSDFILYLSSLFPRVSIVGTTVTNHGGGLFRIKAEVENAGFLPTATAQGVVSRSVKPTMVQLGVAPEDIVSGDAKTSFFAALAGSAKRRAYEWIIKGKPGATVTLKVVSQKGGSDQADLTLK